MTEQKLQQTANALPEHKSDFLAVEEAYRKSQARPKFRSRRRAVLICLVCLLLVGCMAGPAVPEYHLYNGSLALLFPGIAFDEICDLVNRDPELASAQKFAEELDWSIPQTLGSSPCCGAEKYNLTTKEANWFMAMLFHHYTYHSIDYGYETETELTREDGSSTTAHWTDADAELTFGSMDNEVWRRQFSFDENDAWAGSRKYLDFIDGSSFEYDGFILYVGTRQFHDDFYGLLSSCGQYVSWVDYDHNTVFQIYCRDDEPDFAIACAKELIDQMH